MVKEFIDVLRFFYNKLENNVIREEKGLRNGSLLWTLMEIQAKKTEKYLSTSVFPYNSFPNELIDILIDKKLICLNQKNPENNGYVISAMGIWEIEKQTYNYSETNLLGLIQEKYFTFEVKPLDDNDKLAVFSLLCIRNFSAKIPMDLNTPKHREKWTNIFELVFEFLKQHGYLKADQDSFRNLDSKQKSEHPVQILMRHRNNLPIKSGHVFNFGGNSKYYLNLVENGEIQSLKLKHAFKLVIPSIPDRLTASMISDFCIRMANDYAKYVVTDYQYIDSTHDEIIERVINHIYID